MSIKANSNFAIALQRGLGGGQTQDWVVERVTMPSKYDEFPGDESAGIPAGSSAFEFFFLIGTIDKKYVSARGDNSICAQGAKLKTLPLDDDPHQFWWALVPADEGKYKLVSMCKDSMERRCIKEQDFDLEWVKSPSDATPVDIELDYVLSPGGKAVIGMLGVTIDSAPATTEFSITAEELVAQMIAALKTRGEEVGHPLSDDEAAGIAKTMGGAVVTLPKSQAEVDEQFGQIKGMPKEGFEQMLAMIKSMAQ